LPDVALSRACCPGDYLGLSPLDGRAYTAWLESLPLPGDTDRPGESTVPTGDIALEPVARRSDSWPTPVGIGAFL
jgi:hypothetical protein